MSCAARRVGWCSLHDGRAPTIAVSLLSFAVFLYSARANAQSAPLIGLRLSNADDCVEVADLAVVDDGDDYSATIGVAGGAGRNRITNVGEMVVSSSADGTADPVTALATGITVAGPLNANDEPKEKSGPDKQSGPPERRIDSKCERPRENPSGSVGSPDNVIVNASTMSIDATAGAIDATAPIAVESGALGIEGSDGADVVVNDGALSVTATATLAIAEFASGGAATGADKGTPEKAKGNEHANDNSRHNGGGAGLPAAAQGAGHANPHARHGDDEDPSGCA
jgi:hypothetical protein